MCIMNRLSGKNHLMVQPSANLILVIEFHPFQHQVPNKPSIIIIIYIKHLIIKWIRYANHCKFVLI